MIYREWGTGKGGVNKINKYTKGETGGEEEGQDGTRRDTEIRDIHLTALRTLSELNSVDDGDDVSMPPIASEEMEIATTKQSRIFQYCLM